MKDKKEKWTKREELIYNRGVEYGKQLGRQEGRDELRDEFKMLLRINPYV